MISHVQILQLYLVTDSSMARPRSVAEVVAEALDGGVTLVQYRSKETSVRDMLDEGQSVREACRDKGIPFLVNDRVDLALALEADGVHLGQTDLPVAEARKILGDQAIIGLTVESVAQAEEGSLTKADYLAASPVFFTATKPEAGSGLGIEGVKKIIEVSSLPIVAIGGIDAERAGRVIAAGCAGVAVVSAIMASSDPRAAAAGIRQAILDGGG